MGLGSMSIYGPVGHDIFVDGVRTGSVSFAKNDGSAAYSNGVALFGKSRFDTRSDRTATFNIHFEDNDTGPVCVAEVVRRTGLKDNDHPAGSRRNGSLLHE
jgi:hypothetical protein